MAIRTAVGLYGLDNILGGDFRKVTEIVKRADAEGIDQVVMTDHVIMGTRTDRYPYGPFPSPPEYPWFEPIVAMSAFSAVTTRIRLSMSVLIAPLRPAPLLAKQAATLDVMSSGRLDLGVGTGWQREEYDAEGLDFARRWQLFDDGLRACRVLWRDAPATFASPTVSFRDTWCLPRPVQPGGPPLWFGVALGAKNLARIADLGAGWMPMDSRPEALRTGIAKLREAFRAAGRAWDGFGVRAHVEYV